MNREFHKRKGLTLIELAAVTALLGLFAVMLSTTARGFGDAPAVHAAQLSIEQAWSQVRMQARARHRPTALILDVGGARMATVLDTRQSHTWIDLGGVTIRRAGYVGDSLVTAGSITFKVSAAGSALPWVIELERGTSRCVLAASGVTGRVRTWRDRALDQINLDEEVP